MEIVYYGYEKPVRRSQYGFLYAVFLELFKVDLFTKKRILSFIQGEIYAK